MRTRLRSLLQTGLTIAFALVLPIASAHCATMSMKRGSAQGAASAMRADHACCAAGATSGARQAPGPAAPSDCACLGLPSGATPALLSLDVPVSFVSLLAVAALPSAPAQLSLPHAMRSSDPPPDEPEAGGLSLRGPPARA